MTPTPTTSAIANLRDLLVRGRTFVERRADLERLKAEHEASTDYTLSAAEVAQYAELVGGLQLAQAIEKPLRATLSTQLSRAGNEFSKTADRIRGLHRSIDEAIRQRIIARLPADLKVDVVFGEVTVDVREAFASKVAAPSKVHIDQSAEGAAEKAARIDPISISAVSYFDPNIPTAQILKVVESFLRACDKAEAEEQRAAAVLARYSPQQKAA